MCPLELPSGPRADARARVAMALSKLSGDEQGTLFVQLCNVLDPGVAVALSSVSNELRTATHAPLQQLKTGHKAAAALCCKLGHRNCKALREAKEVYWYRKCLTVDELKLLGTLGSVLPARDAGPLRASSRPGRRAATGGEAGRGRAAGRDLSESQ